MRREREREREVLGTPKWRERSGREVRGEG